MTSVKSNFDDFTKYPGYVNKETGLYEFPTLIHKDSSGKIRIWRAYIRLIKTPDEFITDINWNLLDEKQVPIKDKYFQSPALPEYTIAQSWVETGRADGKITQSAPSYFTKLAFEGNANQRNQFQQALISVNALFRKRKEKGSKEENEKESKVPTVMYFPMLAKRYKDGAKHLEYPLYVQPKLNGVRCVICLTKRNGGPEDILIYSRGKKKYYENHIRECIYPYLKELYDEESIYLDGELYKHGKPLQEITGDAKNAITSDNKNEFHIFDCFYPSELATPFEVRQTQLDILFDGINDRKDPNALKYIKRVPTTLVNDEKEAEKLFKDYTKRGYEGIMLRNKYGPYLSNNVDNQALLRSNNLVKMKRLETDEYEIAGYKEGVKGKDKGAIIWVLKLKDSDETFDVTPKGMTYAERYKTFEDCEKNFAKKYKGRMMTIEYEELSKDKVPLRAKALTIRDQE